MLEFDTVVTLGAPTLLEAQQRVRKSLELYADGIAPHMIVTGAFWALRRNAPPSQSIGMQMHDYAIKNGLGEDAITVADQSFDTIGDALATKHVLRERNARSVALVTTDTHVARAKNIFDHVLGPNYQVAAFGSGDFPARRGQALYEAAGRALSRAVLRGTEPGDDDEIMSRLFSLVPRYTDATTRQIAANHVRQLLGLSLVQFTPIKQWV